MRPPLVIDLRRESDRRHVQQGSFQRSGDRARVGYVVPDVETAVDPRDDEIGLVDGGTVDRPWGHRSFIVHDPDDIPIHIYCELPSL